MFVTRFPRRARAAATLAGAAALAAFTLTACGEDEGAAEPTSEPTSETSAPAADAPNASDVAFAQGMIPHHQQALDMAELAADRAADPEVRALAEEISAAQGPEIATLTGWLEEWGAEPAPDDNHSGHGGGHEEHQGMSGMMSEDQRAALAAAEGPAFDALFLDLMIEHHEGAVAMAENQLAEGAHPDALELAEAIVADQRAEIDRMAELLLAED
ncbi:DUF305 domain-containing protein [Streptomyces sp. 3MP-14]|uniref:DUF305 domain-containing protein n=1 Tax=Streptomyces mimosae TaxID=2586635 RepID=A0A5N6ALE2_9ACTN|nr:MULTISPECIES: DUF305 domain-containing protein [Streptomyces]KAB8168883.1 DUF305 domain-containing protein [Streptomyces mimosae]KAB8177838.1 DUF305 domain-containing protein [Streptomyces sp. 3MP-14]